MEQYAELPMGAVNLQSATKIPRISTRFKLRLNRNERAGGQRAEETNDQTCVIIRALLTEPDLTVPARVGNFDILNMLGKGGMGEVFRARDAKLERDVALKFLPSQFASDREWMVRFQREARALASLNHPNVAQIHGLEQSGATQFLVLEQGETLAERIKRVRFPLTRRSH